MAEQYNSNNNEYRINIQDVLDFCFCPKYYDIKNKYPNKRNMKIHYDISLHEAFYSYLVSLQQGVLKNSIDFLKKKWADKWIKQKRSEEIMLTPSATKRDTYDAKRISGINAIITFDRLMDEPQVPIAINLPYEFKISSNITLTGIYEYIREIPLDNDNSEIQILKFRTENNRFQIKNQRLHDLELTAANMAFHKMFNVNSEPRLVYVDIYEKKMIPSYRTKDDEKDLIKSIKSVVTCINNNIRCYSPDCKCYHCEYRNECLKG